VDGRPGPPASAAPHPFKWALAGCLVLALLSLVTPSEPTYDPWAWIIWGREITEWDLDTMEGPSWKPLPIFFTTPFALLGDDVAPAAWLVVARAGGFFALVMAFRLAARFAGPAAGAIAAAALLVADDFIRNFWRGNSEGLLVAICLLAVERHLDGRRGQAFGLAFAAGLLRPEVWPFLGLYGLWLAWREPRTRLWVAGAFALTGLLWFVPEYFGSGNFLRAAERARDANPDAAANADRPFLEVFRRSQDILMVPVLIGAVIGTAYAIARRERALGAIAAGAAVLMVAVALMTEAGFAGNLRYVALPAALVCVLAGVGWTWLVGSVRRRAGRAAAGALVAALVAGTAAWSGDMQGDLRMSIRLIGHEARFYGEADRAIAIAGGRAAVLACGGIFTGNFSTQALAWRLHVHAEQVDISVRTAPPGTVFGPEGNPLASDERFPRVGATRKWVVRQACR
jgi:hypothetical protein